MPNTWGSKHTIYSVTSWDQYCYTAVIPATKSHELTWSKLPIFCLLVDFVWWHFLVKCKWNTTYITTIMKHMICVPYKIHESYISQSRYASTSLRHHGAFMFRHHQIGVRPSLNMVLIGQGLWWHMNPSLHHTHSVAVNTPCSTEVERSVKVLCSFLYDSVTNQQETRMDIQLLWITFWSQMGRFANNFYEWRIHSLENCRCHHPVGVID